VACPNLQTEQPKVFQETTTHIKSVVPVDFAAPCFIGNRRIELLGTNLSRLVADLMGVKRRWITNAMRLFELITTEIPEISFGKKFCASTRSGMFHLERKMVFQLYDRYIKTKNGRFYSAVMSCNG